MLETEQKIENYELGFHLLPEMEEGKLNEKVQEIEGMIIKLGGSVTSSRPVKRQHLSYPIDHKKYAFFGTLNFKMPTEGADQIRDQLKLEETVLRSLILKTQKLSSSTFSLRTRLSTITSKVFWTILFTSTCLIPVISVIRRTMSFFVIDVTS